MRKELEDAAKKSLGILNECLATMKPWEVLGTGCMLMVYVIKDLTDEATSAAFTKEVERLVLNTVSKSKMEEHGNG